MGTIHHTALLITGSNNGFGEPKNRYLVTKAYKRAVKLFGEEQVSPVIGSGMNGYYSFFVAPSGSKLGWEQAIEHEAAMEKMIEFLDLKKYSDGSTSIKYVKVSYGEFGLQASDWRGIELDAEDR